MIPFKKKNDSSETASDATPRDPRKAQRFFEHAQTVADARNYDYAVQCYVDGLRYEPDAMEKHEALREVALRRKVGGGKAAGFMEQFKLSGGKTELDKMLNAELLWAKDPLNATLALSVMEHAVGADLPEVAYWVGDLVLEANRGAKKPSKQIYVKARDLYAQIEAYGKAVEACRQALAMDPQNMRLMAELKDLDAERAMLEGRYGEEGADFRQSVRDVDKQRALEQEGAMSKTESVKDQVIARARADYEDNPEDLDKLSKLVNALLQKEEVASEDEAIDLLQEAWERSGQYRFKVKIGDIRIKQFNRQLRTLRQQVVEGGSGSEEAKEQMRLVAGEKVKFELNEFTERVKNYPTDMGLRFELGRRQFAVQDYDKAIASFQEAQADPKYRAQALRYLGASFAAKEWYDEAIDTFRRGMEAHGSHDDRLALELRYDLMDALAKKAARERDAGLAQEAMKIGSQIAQMNINYRDIRNRVDELRGLNDTLRGNGNGGNGGNGNG